MSDQDAAGWLGEPLISTDSGTTGRAMAALADKTAIVQSARYRNVTAAFCTTEDLAASWNAKQRPSKNFRGALKPLLMLRRVIRGRESPHPRWTWAHGNAPSARGAFLEQHHEARLHGECLLRLWKAHLHLCLVVRFEFLDLSIDAAHFVPSCVAHCVLHRASDGHQLALGVDDSHDAQQRGGMFEIHFIGVEKFE